jgi:hypothetical protein
MNKFAGIGLREEEYGGDRAGCAQAEDKAEGISGDIGRRLAIDQWKAKRPDSSQDAAECAEEQDEAEGGKIGDYVGHPLLALLPRIGRTK